MYYNWNSNQNKTDHELYLESELERYREEEERRQEEREREQDRKRQERQERHDWYMRSADDWHEALEKQSTLFWREFNMYPELNEEDDYFELGAKACDRALEIWKEEEPKVQQEIEALEKRIEELHESVRISVGKRLLDESDKDGWKHVAHTLIEPDSDPSSWLNW